MTVIHLTSGLRRNFRPSRITGHGGFQSLARQIGSKIIDTDVRLDDETLARVSRYATRYGSGGFQNRFRLLLALWMEQHEHVWRKRAA